MNTVHISPTGGRALTNEHPEEPSTDAREDMPAVTHGRKRRSPRSLLRETRGAVYVEFLIAFLPVFVFFLCMIQLALLFSAKLMVEHAAVTGARAAAVVFGDEPTVYKETSAETNIMTKARRQAVRDAVVLSLAPLIVDGSLVALDVVFPGATPDEGVRSEGTTLAAMSIAGTHMIRVRVEAKVVCKIALADAIACSGIGNTLRDIVGFARVADVRAESAFPYQGAKYVYSER